MKHHNLYRLTLIGYLVGGVFTFLAFLMVFIAITITGSPFEGLAWLFGTTGVLLLVGGGIAHVIAITDHEELKPLPKEIRDKIDQKARNRRADLELETALETAEDRARAIEGRPVSDSDWR